MDKNRNRTSVVRDGGKFGRMLSGIMSNEIQKEIDREMIDRMVAIAQGMMSDEEKT